MKKIMLSIACFMHIAHGFQIVGYFYNATGKIIRLWHFDQTPYRFLPINSLQQIPEPVCKDTQVFLFAYPGTEQNYNTFDVIKNGQNKIKTDYVIIFEKADTNSGIAVRAVGKKEFDAQKIREEIEKMNVVPCGPSKIIADYAV